MRLVILVYAAFLLGATTAQLFGAPPGSRPSGNQRNLRLSVPGGYLPPTPIQPVCMPTTKYVTETSTQETVVTSYTQGPSGGVFTSTLLITRSSPTTVYEADVSTKYSTYVQKQTSTQLQVVTSTYTQSVGGIPVTRTVSSTVIVPERVESTAYSTVLSSTFITRTNTERDVTTVVEPYTTTRIQQVVDTSTSVVYGRDETRTTTFVTSILSTVQTQPPPETAFQTRAVESTIYDTTTIQPQPSFVTQTQTSTYLDQAVQTTTYRDIVTSTQLYTSTVVRATTIRDTQIQTVTSTRQVQETSQVVSTSTRVTTQFQPTTIYGTQVVTRTETQPPVYSTSTAERFVTETRDGGFDVVTNTKYSTRTVQSTTTIQAGAERQTVTVTRTVQDDCSQVGYQYNEPSIPFKT